MSEGSRDALSRQHVVMEKGRYVLIKTDSGTSVQFEELDDEKMGYEKKMMSKQVSVQESGKKGLDDAFEPRSRSFHAYEFGDRRSDDFIVSSGSSQGIGVLSEYAGTSKPTHSNTFTVPRNNLGYTSLSCQTWDSMDGLNERIVAQGNSKYIVRKGDQVSLDTTQISSNANHMASSARVANSSLNFLHTPETLDERTQLPCSKTFESLNLENFQKRIMPKGPSSYPMIQLVDHRPQKISQKRREDLFSNRDEAQLSFEGVPPPDTATILTCISPNEPEVPRMVSSSIQLVRMDSEDVLSPAFMFESKEPSAGENRLNQNEMHNDKEEDRAANAVHKVGPLMLPAKKNTVLDEQMRHGVQRGGQYERVLSISRDFIPQTKQMLENPPARNALQSKKQYSNNNRRKVDHSPLKELSGCNDFKHPGAAYNGGSSDPTNSEPDDDNKELLQAANYARSARSLAYSELFWKRVEPVFAFPSSNDKTFLKQQQQVRTRIYFKPHKWLKCWAVISPADVVLIEEASSQNIVCGERQEYQLNGTGSDVLDTTVVAQSQDNSASCGGLVADRSFENMIPLSQLLLSAMIDEDEIEELNCDNGDINGTMHNAFKPNDGDSVESEVGKSDSNLLYNGESLQETNGLAPSEVEATSQSDQDSSDISSIDYQNMSFEDRCRLELQSIGLYNEKLCAGEHEEQEIDRDITELRKKLHQQVIKKKVQLCKLDELVQKERDAEGWDLEHSALNKLVEIAYKRCKACSRRRARKVSKQKARAFAERTIARCRDYEKTGKSCFLETGPYNVLSSPCSDVSNNAESVGAIEFCDSQVQSDKGVSSTRIEEHSTRGHTLIRVPNARPLSRKAFQKLQPKLKRVRERKTFDNAGNAASSCIGTKRRRNERMKDQHKDMSTTKSVVKVKNCFPPRDCNGKFITKPKSRKNTAQPSTSGNGVLDRFPGTTYPVFSSLETPETNEIGKANESELPALSKICQDSTGKVDEFIDFEDLNLSYIGQVDLRSPGKHFTPNAASSDTDEVIVQECYTDGLEVPTDDLSELDLFI
ncbi:hypothetical protein IFM89_024878 [Coptis chinensis]|uniref:Uncharacterized protein n=1 Tax=Coptis chinensis TaxID=261450 RepID=A0A835LGD7_9MAGN|nr:hypothetical protein IFM89_024878 [Coptis chinensis]